MGVLACDRKGCEHIMCDYLVDDKYVCTDCQGEFEEFVKNSDRGEEFSERNMLVMFREFMDTPKDKDWSKTDRITVKEFFERNKKEY